MDESLRRRIAVSDALAHHGIKGQKWGVRRKRGSVSTIKKGSESHASADAVTANNAHATVKKHGSAALSNKDLQSLVTRMNLEQQLSTLSGKNKGTVKKGAGVAAKIVANVATQQATRLANDVISKQINTALNKK